MTTETLVVGVSSEQGVKLIIAGCAGAPSAEYHNFMGTSYIHDLYIEGAPMVIIPPTTGIKDLLNGTSSKSNFYMLGKTNLLKVDSEKEIRTIVIYNSAGSVVKILKNVGGTTVDVSFLPEGIYYAYAFDVNSKKLTGGFVKY
jgi:hypothetical protein